MILIISFFLQDDIYIYVLLPGIWVCHKHFMKQSKGINSVFHIPSKRKQIEIIPIMMMT
jgi:hypothetical protein